MTEKNFLVPGTFGEIDASEAGGVRGSASVEPERNPPIWPDFDPSLLRTNSDDGTINAARNLIAVSGDAALDGDNGCDFDGDGDNLNFPAEPDFQLGDSDWFFGQYVYLNDIVSSQHIFSRDRLPSGEGDISFRWSGGNLQFNYWVSGVRKVGTLGAWSPTLQQYAYISVIRDGVTLRCHVGGVQIGTYNIGTDVIDANTQDFRYADYLIYPPAFNQPLNGKLSHVEAKIGTANGVTAASYTPPVRTDAIVVGNDTKLALNFDGDALSKRVIDSARPSYDDGGGAETDPGAIPGLVYDSSGNEYDMTPAGNLIYTAVDDKLTSDGTGYMTQAATPLITGLRTLYWRRSYTKPVGSSDTIGGDAGCLIQMNTSGQIVVNAGSSQVMSTNDYSGADYTFALWIAANGTARLYVENALVGTKAVGTGANAAFGVDARNDGDSPIIGSGAVPMMITPRAFESALYNLIAK